ncbi:MAG: serine hydrolase domain-containing protein [Bacteroidota bacterium]
MKNLHLLPLILLLSIVVFTSCDDDDVTTPPQPTVSTAAELTAALSDIYQNTDAPGFAVSVVKNDAVIYQQAFGKADIENNQAYTNQTVQPIGSISKTFVAAAIVKAIEQGYFTLDTDVNDILPVEITNPKQPNATIRVKDLVTHTSGLLDQPEAYLQAYYILSGEDLSTPGAEILRNGFGMQQRDPVGLDEFLAEYYLADGDLYSLDNFAATEPGSTWNYSNLATSLAAFLVEAATGTSFSTYVETHILQPLDMNQTAYEITAFSPGQLAQLYWDQSTPLPNYANDSYPDASVYTNSDDLTKFLMDMMQGAKGQSNTLFSAVGYEMLFNALLPAGITPSFLADNHGVFWFLGGTTIKHDGSDPGTTCNLEFAATGESGYFLLTNMDASTTEHETAYFTLAQEVDIAIQQFVQAN